MEQNTDTGAPVTPIVENKQKSGNGWKIATAIACIAAVCGIGFGAYGIMQSLEKDNQISALKSEVTKLKLSVEELKGDTTETDDTIPEPDKAYLTVDNWNLRIIIPDSFSRVSYVIKSDTWMDITATLKNDQEKTATVGLARAEKTAVESGNTQWTNLDEAVFLDDTFAYFLMYTDTVPERDLTTDELIMDALSDSSLYSSTKKP